MLLHISIARWVVASEVVAGRSCCYYSTVCVRLKRCVLDPNVKIVCDTGTHSGSGNSSNSSCSNSSM